MSEGARKGAPADARAALLDRILRQKGRAVVAQETIPRRRGDGPAPLSFVQQRIWFYEQLEPGNVLYHMPAAFRCRGPLDAAVLERSLNEIVRRHEALRTTFVDEGGQPRQVVAPSLTLRVAVSDLRALPAAERAAEVRRRIALEGTTPFDLSRGPLVRVGLLALEPEEHLLLLTVHHIVFDGWSRGVLWKELAALYAAFAAGRPSPLDEPTLQYADYAAWQHEHLRLDKQLAYWKERLSGELPPLMLPTDRPRATRGYAGAVEGRELPAALLGALDALARKEGATQFMTLLSALALLFSRLAGQDDVLVGTAIAGRNRAETEGMMGMFVNSLVLRTDLSGEPTFRELLARVRISTLGAFEHQDLPFEKLVEELNPTRSPGENPLFDVFVNYVAAGTDEAPPTIEGLTIAPEPGEVGDSKFLLTCYFVVEGERLRVAFHYRRELFAAERVRAMLDQLVQLLEEIAADPGRPIGSYSLLTPGARALLPDPSQPLEAPPHPAVTRQIAAIAAAAPEAIALHGPDGALTYGQLDRQIDRLARSLVARGLGRGEVVAIFGPRSFGLVTAIAAVMRAGGAFLTVEGKHPEERQRLMLREAAVRRAVCVGPAVGWLAGAGLDVLGLGLDGVVAEGADAPLPELEPGDPAYVFFTSGTTGVPKAVLGQHQGLAHFVDWQREAFGIGPGDRSAQLTGLSFNVLLRDVFTPLTSGATLCLPPPAAEDFGPGTLGWLERERITILHSVPSVLQALLTQIPAGVELGALRLIFSAGEPLLDALVRRWRAAFPGSGEIVLLYGQTETTLAKCCFRVPVDPPPGAQPAGRSLPDSQALVLSPTRQRCGIGEPGEVAIRTPFRTLGYLNAPEENRRRFVPNPFRNDDRDLVYLTGDRGRYRPDGALEIIGRVDDQLKVRGMRVEPREVQAALASHPSVQAAAVIAREAPSGDKRLVAYYVARAGGSLAPHELRDFLRGRLPDFMVPAAFVALPSLPLTANGKLDRQRLPEPEPAAEAQASFVAPRSPDEELLAGVWAQALGVAKVGVHDDFFALGGHSLLATQTVARVREVLGVELAVRDLFDGPTVGQLAERVAAARLERQRGHQPPHHHEGPVGELPLTPSQLGPWRMTMEAPEVRSNNLSQGLRLTGPLDVAALERSLAEIVRRHDGVRMTFVDRGGGPVARVSAPGFALPLVDASAEDDPPARARVLAAEETVRAVDLAVGPLFRATLFRLAPEDHLLALNTHHIVFDGVSWGVLFRELRALYDAFANGRASPLPEPALQYSDYARWLVGYLASEPGRRHLEFWQRRCANLPRRLTLPTDRPRTATVGQWFTRATMPWVFSPALSASIEALARRRGCTLFMVLLAAFEVVLLRETRQEDIAVGAYASGRRSDTMGLLGQFVSFLVLRTDLSGDPPFSELLTRVRDMVLETYEHQEVSAQGPTPVVHAVSIIMNHVHPAEPSAPAAETTPLAMSDEPIRRPAGVVRFDLQVETWRGEQSINVGIQYNAELFLPSTIVHLVREFQSVLQQVVVDPTLRLSALG